MNQTTEDLSNDPWLEAKRIASLIDLAPSTIVSCIRFLRRDVEERSGIASPVSRYCLRTILKSRNLRSALYHAALAYRPEQINSTAPLTWDSFLQIFTLDELSYLIGMLFVFRRIKRGCNPEQFIPHSKALHAFADVGALVGTAIPRIGLGRGLLLGTMRHLACAMFLGIDEKGFIKYRRAARLDGRTFDLETELKLWNTTHAHVGSYLIQLLGYGVREASAFMQACSPPSPNSPEPAPEVYCSRITQIWIESFINTGAPPQMVHRGEYYPKAVDMGRITAAVAPIRTEGSSLWMTKNRVDLSAEVAARLEPPQEEQAAPEISADLAQELESLGKEEE